MSQQEFIQKCYEQDIKVIVIGTSAGGVDALKRLLPSFQKGSKLSVAVVIHIPPRRPNLIPDLLRDYCSFNVKEASSAEALSCDTIYFAPPDYHLSLEANETLSLSSEEPLNFSRPSIDILLESAAYAYGKRVLAVILTGANEDGARGLKVIKKQGGLAIVQSPEEAEYPFMPNASAKAVKPDAILTLNEIKTVFALLSGVVHE